MTELLDKGIEFNCFNEEPIFALISLIRHKMSLGTLTFGYKIK